MLSLLLFANFYGYGYSGRGLRWENVYANDLVLMADSEKFMRMLAEEKPKAKKGLFLRQSLSGFNEGGRFFYLLIMNFP